MGESGATTNCFEIELSLVDISESVEQDSSSSSSSSGGEQLKERVDKIFDAIKCDSAEAFLFRKPQDLETHHRLKEQVLRYVRLPDKYISLTSILLKSQAFHKTHHFPEDEQNQNQQQQQQSEESLPVVEIPRTQYKKPYIPTSLPHDSFPEVNLYPLSISHQYPFVGMARLVIDAASTTKDPRHRPLVGLDIVTFDDYNTRLYSSTEDFIEVFHEQFTPWEWNCITNNQAEESSSLKEFYLRWAIKEAYTKALGVGLGLSFDSFETRLDIAEEGIFSWLCGCQQQHRMDGPLPLQGSVVLKPGKRDCKTESCSFFFLPLWERESGDSNKTVENARGCACICLVHSQAGGKYRLSTSWNNLEDLIGWSQC